MIQTPNQAAPGKSAIASRAKIGHLRRALPEQHRFGNSHQHPMNSTINLSFRYAENDYVRALRAHYASQLHLHVDILVILVLLGAGAYLWRSPSLHWLAVAGIALALVFALMLIAAFTLIPILAFRREPKFRNDYTLAFSPEVIHFRTADVDSQLQWSMYSRALVDAHSYVLYYGTRQFTVIPKRVFQSADQRRAFEQMLTGRISNIIRRDR